MNPIEKLINELHEDCSELYYKNRTDEEKSQLLTYIIRESRDLKELAEEEHSLLICKMARKQE